MMVLLGREQHGKDGNRERKNMEHKRREKATESIGLPVYRRREASDGDDGRKRLKKKWCL